MFKNRTTIAASIGLIMVMAAINSAGDILVKLGMTQKEVMAVLGEPDKKAILSGKVLKDLQKMETDTSEHRTVFIYHEKNLKVWFLRGVVTGVTNAGLSGESSGLNSLNISDEEVGPPAE